MENRIGVSLLITVVMNQTFRRILSALLLSTLTFSSMSSVASAHNGLVHQQMTEFAYELMRTSGIIAGGKKPAPQIFETSWKQMQRLVGVAPNGIPQTEWDGFIKSLGLATEKLKTLPSSLPPPKSVECSQKLDSTKFCSQSFFNSATPPATWWQGKFGDIRLPVSKSYRSGSDCGVWFDWTAPEVFIPFNNCNTPNHYPDHTGTALGLWAKSVDDELNDGHMWIRPTSAGFQGTLNKFSDEAIKGGAMLGLIPIVCGTSCLLDVVGLGGGACKKCLKASQELGNKTPTPTDVQGFIPGGGDHTSDDYTGMWHFINMNSGLSNEFDDRQGLYYDEAGLDRIPGVVDMAIIAGGDLTGLSVNYDSSLGPKRYQIGNADDSHQNTDFRGLIGWQKYTIGHTPFEPVDNLAFYGWREFQKNPNQTNLLAWPLHALGDATSPMHVIGSTAYGHRPFEDAQERLWPDISKAMGQDLNNILLRAFIWRLFINKWRSAHAGHNADIPIREMVTALAQQTYSYSRKTQTTDAWPFNDDASFQYFVSDKNKATERYMTSQIPNAVTLVVPLIENGIAAKIAFLSATAEAIP